MRVLRLVHQYTITDWEDSDDEILLDAYRQMAQLVAEQCKGVDDYIGTTIEIVHSATINKED